MIYCDSNSTKNTFSLVLVKLYFHIWLKYIGITAGKVSKYGVISGPYFPLFGLNTDQK